MSFRDLAMKHLDFLETKYGFKEQVANPSDATNPYQFSSKNEYLTLIIDSIMYGNAIETTFFARTHVNTHGFGDLPIIPILVRRMEKLGKKIKPPGISPLEDELVRLAKLLMDYGDDILSGNLAEVQQLLDARAESEEKRKATAVSKEQKDANTAAALAGHAFKSGNYKQVIELLEPHLPYLPDSVKKKYEISKSRN